MKRISECILIFVMIFSNSIIFAQTITENNYTKGELLITFDKYLSDADIDEILERYDLKKARKYEIVGNTYLVKEK
ncbi:MAG: hypothetical protein P8X42_15365, partial [Calditrichaceae bacterium]